MANDNLQTSNSLPIRNFSKVVISLDNIIIPKDKLSPTPSEIDGLDIDSEIQLRILGCELIQTSGILLKLPQVAMATGQIIFQRFYYSKSLVKHNFEVVAMACINLASKIEEDPRRIRDVMNVFHHIKLVKDKKPIQPMILDQSYISMKSQVIKAERRILKELGFCVHVKHPHKLIVTYLQTLNSDNTVSGKDEQERKTKYKNLMQLAWNYMNDSLRCNIWVCYRPESIACSCIFLAARIMHVPLPNQPPWYRVFGATDAEVEDIALKILNLYSLERVDCNILEERVNKIKQALNEAKHKLKATSNVNTPEAGNKTSPIDERNDKNNSPTIENGGLSNKANGILDNDLKSDNNKPKRIDIKKLKKRIHDSKSRSRSPHSRRRMSPKRRKDDRQKSRNRRRSLSRSPRHKSKSHHRSRHSNSENSSSRVSDSKKYKNGYSRDSHH